MSLENNGIFENITQERERKAFIYTGGDIYPDLITEHPKGDDLCIAADSGYDNAVELGERTEIFIGDMDSLGARTLPADTEVIKLNPEKDLTDTQAAVELAISRGVYDIVIVGGIGSRLDHTVSNLYILEDMFLRHVHAIIVNGKNRVRYINSTSTLIGRSAYKYLSVIAADSTVKGVCIDGCKYPLKNDKINRRLQFAVSNEIEGNCALISVRKGGIFIIESID